jgi:hypothetical protein
VNSCGGAVYFCQRDEYIDGSNMNQMVKDLLQAAAWIATFGGVVVALVKFLAEIRDTRQQRERDLRWRQAQAGKALNDEMQTDAKAWAALQMLDSPSREYSPKEGKILTVATDDISAALDPAAHVPGETDEFIRDSFDTLFYFMAMFEHYISSGLIRPDDVAYPMEYYVPLLARHYRAVSAYLDKYDLWRARKFLERYPAWHDAGAA